MKFIAKLPPRSGMQLTIEFEAQSVKDAWPLLSQAQEALPAEPCGVCGEGNIRYLFRENKKKHKFYELQCTKPGCRARLSFGQESNGEGIFPRRRYHSQHPLVDTGKAEEGHWLPNNGWEKYEKPQD